MEPSGSSAIRLAEATLRDLFHGDETPEGWKARLRRFLLATKDAHGLYARFGFAPLANPARFLERFDPDVYAPR